MSTDKDIIIIDDTQHDEQLSHDENAPVITIERGEAADTHGREVPNPPRPASKWLRMLFILLGIAIILVGAWGSWRVYCYYYRIGVPISVSPSENINKLQRKAQEVVGPHVILATDTVAGMVLNIYKLRGLQAEVTTQEPDTSDTSVMIYSRSADYMDNGEYIGSMVMRGEKKRSDVSRVGYCGMANGNVVIGVSRSDKVMDYCQQQGGSFFRQFVLLSDGIMPACFYLYGQVERRALARTSDDQLYLTETLHKETLWDFADALRNYGFVDAIYLTGGTCHSWYRSQDGAIHHMGNPNEHPSHKDIAPWIVFRRR